MRALTLFITFCLAGLAVAAEPDVLFSDLEPAAAQAVDWSPLVQSTRFGRLQLRDGLALSRPDPSTARIVATSSEGQARLEDFVAQNAADADPDIKGVGIACVCGGDSGKCAPAGQRGSDGVVCVSQQCTGECSMDIILIPRDPKAPKDEGLRFAVRGACQPAGT